MTAAVFGSETGSNLTLISENGGFDERLQSTFEAISASDVFGALMRLICKTFLSMRAR
jgi:hypothetical protein